MTESAAHEGGGSAAATLRALAVDLAQPRVSVADLLAALDDRGFGLLLLVLALPNAVPGPMIPGFSVPFALGIAALGVQLALGLHRPRLPRWLRAASVSQERFRRFVERTAPLLRRVERWLRPRPSALTQGLGERLIGIVLVALSVVLALPVPFGNVPVALAIMVIALGLLEGDGAALAVGLAAGIAAVLWNGSLVLAGAVLVQEATHLH